LNDTWERYSFEQAAVTTILPKQCNGISYGGSEGVVMMLDLDCHFDMLRFVSVLKLRINQAHGIFPIVQSSVSVNISYSCFEW
jgi:hypothetical protein